MSALGFVGSDAMRLVLCTALATWAPGGSPVAAQTPGQSVPGVRAAAAQPRPGQPPAGEQGPAADAALRAALEKSTADYAAAYNSRDFSALANQWTTGALLAEGGGALIGRDRIVESIGAWAGRNPDSKLEMTLTGVLPLGATVARVKGVVRFVPKPGARALESHFESLRVLDGGEWRLAESIVTPSQNVAMEQLAWLLGTWTATDPTDGAVLECRYERAADGHVILGRTTITPKGGTPKGGTPKGGTPLESIDVIHADTATGTIRSWVFDSTGARAEGVFETDGTAFNRAYEGLTAHGTEGLRSRWVQMMVPTGPTTIVMRSIERSVDGRPVADGRPWHLQKKADAAPAKP
ncbi:MAG: nuclear transport factor 2 family protein [Planctomycetia bacterium]|nr:nuclear transport factor 2 family protein [Planctomycetia bacterium]